MVGTKENNTSERGLENIKEKSYRIHREGNIWVKTWKNGANHGNIKRKNNLGRKISKHKCSAVEAFQYVWGTARRSVWVEKKERRQNKISSRLWRGESNYVGPNGSFVRNLAFPLLRVRRKAIEEFRMEECKMWHISIVSL